MEMIIGMKVDLVEIMVLNEITSILRALRMSIAMTISNVKSR